MSKAETNQDILTECATIGAAVLASQRIEFLLYGLVAHVKPELKRSDKKFRYLTPESFLRGDPSDLRATLGQLAKAYGTKLLLSANDLEAFVRNRNLIVHDYWRLSRARIRDGATLENPMAFLQQFLADCLHWEGILRGVLATMRVSVAQETGSEQEFSLTPEDLNYMDQYCQHVRSNLVHKPK